MASQSPISQVHNTLRPGKYNSFAMVISSGNNRLINIPELILVSMKVIIEDVFPIMMSMTMWPPVCQVKKITIIWPWRGNFPSKFYIVIFKKLFQKVLWYR